jgi:cytochrome c-type biogenesis protein
VSGDYTILVAAGAGLISFLSPCVLPLVPAYLGQLTAVAVASQGGVAGKPLSRWAAVRHALAYVAGFGTVFTLLGVTAAFAGGAMADYVQPLRVIGGLVLVVMGLSLAGILTIPVLERSWRPLDAGASASLATTTGRMTIAQADSNGGGQGGFGNRFGSRLVAGRTGLGAAFILGSVFAVGWTPCIGAILGGILTMAATSEGRLGGALLLVGYTIGLGAPFVLIAAFYDRSRGLVRFLVRHGRAVSLVGGLLVVAIGLAMIFDLLVLLPRYFQFVPAV